MIKDEEETSNSSSQIVVANNNNNNNHNNPNLQEQPLVGIRFSYIIGEFMQQHGGMEAFQGLTTSEVKDKFIIPPTQELQESYWEMLKKKQLEEEEEKNSVCGSTASAFISHAHQYQFLDTIQAIRAYLEDPTTPGLLKEDPYVFFDIFCINQHRTDWSYKFLSTTFMNSISKFGRTIVVMSPWNDPIPFTRAWCVYEAYCTIVTGNQYEVALSQTERIEFFKAILQDAEGVINTMLATIHAEKSEAYHPEERDRIHTIIRESVGFSKLNALVFEQYRGWVIETTKAALRQPQKEDIDDNLKARLLNALGRLLEGQGKYDEALSCLEEAIKLFDELLLLEQQQQQQQESTTTSNSVDDDDDDDGYDNVNARRGCMYHMALVYQKQNKFSQAQEIFKETFDLAQGMIQELEQQQKKDSVGTEPPEQQQQQQQLQLQLQALHRSKLTAMASLAYNYMSQNNFVEAEKLFLEFMKESKLWLDQNDPLTLSAVNNLGLMYTHQEQWKKAEKAFSVCLDGMREHYGSNHPMTQNTVGNLAVVYRKQGRNEEALPLYEETLAKRREQLGNDHPLTMLSVMNLATCYSALEKFEKAEPLQEEYVAYIQEDNPNIRTHWSNMAFIYAARDKYDQAENLWRKCLSNCPSMDHPDALQYIQYLNNLQDLKQRGRGTTAGSGSQVTEEEAENKSGYLCCGVACLAFTVIGIAVRNL